MATVYIKLFLALVLLVGVGFCQNATNTTAAPVTPTVPTPATSTSRPSVTSSVSYKLTSWFIILELQIHNELLLKVITVINLHKKPVLGNLQKKKVELCDKLILYFLCHVIPTRKAINRYSKKNYNHLCK